MTRAVVTVMEGAAHPGGILPHQRAAKVLANLAGRFRECQACRWTCADVRWIYLAEIRGLRVSILRAEGGAN